MRCTVEGLGGEASSKAEVVLRVVRGPRMGHTMELGRGLNAYWASLEPGEDLGVAEELEVLHGVRVQSDDGVVIVGGFVDNQLAWRLLPLQDRHRVVLLPLLLNCVLRF